MISDSYQMVSHSARQTRSLGRRLGLLCRPGDWIGLTGELGAGKTCLVQGLALGLGVEARVPVTSPTFVLLQIYPGRMPLHHFDIYRLQSMADLADLGYEELCEGDGVCVVEWFNRLPEAHPAQGLQLEISIIDQRSRSIHFQGRGTRGQELVMQLGQALAKGTKRK